VKMRERGDKEEREREIEKQRVKTFVYGRVWEEENIVVCMNVFCVWGGECKRKRKTEKEKERDRARERKARGRAGRRPTNTSYTYIQTCIYV